MSKYPIVFSSFTSGWSTDDKLGTQSSFPYSRHLDFRKADSSLTILPATTLESSATVTGLVTDMIQLPSGKIVAIDTSGGVYTRTTTGVWAKNATILPNTAYGMAYNLQQDTIYIPGTSNVHSITNADGRFGGALTVNASTFTATLDLSATSHANTYTTTTAISELAVDKLSITPTIEPQYSLKLWVTTKGTGNLIAYMHDGANNLMATSSLSTNNITAGQLNEFVFAPAVRQLVKPNAATYHFHITHAGGTASTIGCGTSSDFSTAQFETYGDRLISPTNGFHPTTEFLQYYIFGNANSIVAWEPISQSNPANTEWVRNRVVFPQGYEVTSMAVWNEFLAIACEKRSTTATTEFQDGKIFLWDGTSTTYSRTINIPEGSPYGLFAHKNVLYYLASGSWYSWNNAEPEKVFQLPNTDTEYSSTTYMINYPHTLTVRNGILMAAFPSETDSTAIEHAVYSYGQRVKGSPNSFGYSYSMSTGTRTNGTLRLGMVKSFGGRLFLSWQDGANFGIDIVSPASAPFSTATWESLINDYLFISARRHYPRPDKRKTAVYLEITFKPLPTGATVTPKYKINREANWHTGTAVGVGKESARLNINKAYNEIQVGMDLTAGATTPTIIAVTLIVESLGTEAD